VAARRFTLRVCAGCDDGNGTTSPRLRKRPSTHQRGSSHRAALIDALGRPRIPAEVGHEKLLFNFSLDDARSRQCETSASISCVRFRSLRVPWKARSARAANSLLLLPPLMDGPPLPAELVRLKGGDSGKGGLPWISPFSESIWVRTAAASSRLTARTKSPAASYATQDHRRTDLKADALLIPVEAAHDYEMMSPTVTE
jgi:hypothetical protein